MTDKLLNDPQLAIITCFKSTGVMEYISFMILEGEFVLDVVLATLYET